MNIYLDESYNLQKEKGKMFISINGFAVLDDKIVRKRWKSIRKTFAQSKRRIHATDSYFEELRTKSIKLLSKHNVTILSIFQLSQEIPYRYFEKDGMNFDDVYTALLKKLFSKLPLEKSKKVKIVIDARKRRTGKLGEKLFQATVEEFLKHRFSEVICGFQEIPSSADVLVELADFISNTFYKEYHQGSEHVFKKLGFRLIKIENPL